MASNSDDSDIDQDYDVNAPQEIDSDDSEYETLADQSSLEPCLTPISLSNTTSSSASPVDISLDQPSTSKAVFLSHSTATTSAVTSTPLPAKRKQTAPRPTRKSKAKKAAVPPKPDNSDEDGDGRSWHLGTDNSHANTPIPFLGKHKVNITKTDSPLDIFRYFFDDELIDDIVYNTNLYATQKDVNRPLNLTKGEIFIFLGINITMTYIRYPRLRMYWSSDPSVRCNMIADAMGVNRFESIPDFSTLLTTMLTMTTVMTNYEK